MFRFNRLMVTIALSGLLTSAAFAQNNGVKFFDFGGVNFGATIEEVKESEKDNEIVYESKDEVLVNNFKHPVFKHQALYRFTDGKLTGGMLLIIDEKKENPAEYLNDFNNCDNIFKGIYGEPSSHIVATEDETILSNPAKLVAAVIDGIVPSISTSWEKENYTCIHLLTQPDSSSDGAEEKIGAEKFFLTSPIGHSLVVELNNDNEEDSEIPTGEEDLGDAIESDELLDDIEE